MRRPFVFTALALAAVSLPAAAQAAEVPAASEADKLKIERMLRSQVRRCWNPPSSTHSNTGVRIEFELDRKGRLTGNPRTREVASSNTEVVEYTEEAAKSAVQAVKTCAPYWFPPAAYDHWRNINISFIDNRPPRRATPASPQ